MEWSLWISILLLILSEHTSGLPQLKPVNLTVDMWDGEVMFIWDPPEGAPPSALYQVQMSKYGATQWTNVTSCENIKFTHCDLTHLIDDYKDKYKVRVRLVTKDGLSAWSPTKRFTSKETKLQFPSSTILATLNSVTVKVHKKPLLLRIFPYGLIYIVYLEERCPENKTTMQELEVTSDSGDAEIRFTSLHWGTEYCVSLKVGGSGGQFTSEPSPEKCFFLPEQEKWYVIAVVCFSILCVLGITFILALCICIFLRRPEKMPVALKSPSSVWQPLSMGAVPVERVTDKGWFMSPTRTDRMLWVSNENTTAKVKAEQEDEMDRRTSLDSGVSSKSPTFGDENEGNSTRQEDSGCESLGAPESIVSGNGSEVSPLINRKMDRDVRVAEDSGVGLGCCSGSDASLRGEDCGIRSDAVLVTMDGYRSQSPSLVDAHITEEEFVCETETGFCDAAPGYRSGHVSCSCSGEGRCVWCQARRHYNMSVDGQSVGLCSFTEEQQIFSNLRNDTCEVESTCVGYKKNNLHIDKMVNLVDSINFNPLPNCTGESFPLLQALSEFPLVQGGLNCRLTPLSLGDLEVIFD
ncbi:hypothetical protein UPYG_G00196050 [Umbra pygmaea]|uniref:Fibronectin type-III domain-containing protein n=1 Tax=Umbra pygmaea TaxID=75934 RepID=A0ABD0WMI0_UMBPY